MEGRRSRKLDHETCSCRRLKRHRVALASTPLTLPGHRPASLEDLPEDLIHRVISQLTVTEAGRTSVLSSRWRKRWTYHSNLCFDGTCSELAGYDTDRFVAHVTTVLQHHSRLVVDRFELRSPLLGKEHAHHLDRWFDFAASTKARHVALDLSPLHYEHRIVARPNKYRLPANQLAAPAGIVSLLLVNVCLELPPVSDGSRLLGFKALKKLELKFVVDLGDLTPFLASCPALEWLSISSSLIGHLVVPRQARCLRYLRLDCIGMHSIHLDATSLTTFEYVGTSSIPIKTNHGLKLSQASIFIPWFFDGVSYFWDELSCWLAPVDRLLLSLGMNAETRRFAKNPTEFIHLRHLTLFCHILRDPESPLVVLRLTQVLESAPQLEHLVLHMNSSDPVPFLSKAPDCSIHPHVHHHLKTVQMTGVIGLSGQLELAKYILLSATAVEYMTLSLATPRYRRVRYLWEYRRFTRLEEFAKNYLDPRRVYRNVLKIVGPNV